MKAAQTKMTDVLGRAGTRLVVPVYQRVYSWQRPQLREFWDDLMAAGASETAHFMGTVFYSEEEAAGAGATRLIDVIDGQQRLTTLTLLMCAVRDYLSASESTLFGLDAEGVASRFLQAEDASGAGCKLVLSRADAPTLRWIACGAQRPQSDEEYSRLVFEAYDWFTSRMEADSFDFETLEKGLDLLRVVEVRMDAADRPQTVFESLNAKGLPLSTPDLVRNFLLSRGGEEDPARLYDAYWAPVEDAFSEDADDRYLAHAIRMWTGGSAAIKTDRDIFATFKSSFGTAEGDELEKRVRGLAAYCIDFHEKVASGDEATLAKCREWEESRGKAERLRNDRKIFGD